MRILPISAALLAALSMFGCGGSHEPRKAEATSLPPAAVRTVETRLVEWPSVYETTGTVQAQTAAALSSKVMGYVREVRVQPGSVVKAGDVLVILDSRDLDSALRQAQAAEQEARSGVAEADSGVAAAKAQLSLAQVTFKRMEDLFQKKSISQQEYDEAQARLKTTDAGYQMALSRRAQLDSKIAQVRQAVESAKVMHSYSEIRAPFSGMVTEKKVESGQLATPGALLVTIEQAGAYRLEAPVEESMIGSVRLGQTVQVVLDSANRSVNARVQEIVPAVDPASRAFLVKASLPATPGLRSGLFGRLRISRGAQRALAIPEQALAQRGELLSVLVAESGVARNRMVTVGMRRDGQVEILSGLQAGEHVIHPRPAGLADGARVEVRP